MLKDSAVLFQTGPYAHSLCFKWMDRHTAGRGKLQSSEGKEPQTDEDESWQAHCGNDCFGTQLQAAALLLQFPSLVLLSPEELVAFVTTEPSKVAALKIPQNLAEEQGTGGKQHRLEVVEKGARRNTNYSHVSFWSLC